MPELSEEQRRGYLKEEYFFLQAQYEDYDRRSLTIKGWASTGAVAALALSFNFEHKAGGLLVPIVIGTIIAVVWYLEIYWKMFQYALADRIRIIEAYFRNDDDILSKNPAPLQIYHSWFESYSADRPIYEYEKKFRPQPHSTRFRRVAFQRFVYLPYLPILIFCALALVTSALTSSPKEQKVKSAEYSQASTI
jgi:hypothetical protein